MIRIADGKIIERTANGDRWQALLLSDSAPASLTITGADVDGMNDSDIIAVGSVLATPAKTYIVFGADGTFIERS